MVRIAADLGAPRSDAHRSQAALCGSIFLAPPLCFSRWRASFLSNVGEFFANPIMRLQRPQTQARNSPVLWQWSNMMRGGFLIADSAPIGSRRPGNRLKRDRAVAILVRCHPAASVFKPAFRRPAARRSPRPRGTARLACGRCARGQTTGTRGCWL